jgi:hypothetical protein
MPTMTSTFASISSPAMVRNRWSSAWSEKRHSITIV